MEQAIALAAECLRPAGSFCVSVMADGIAERLAGNDGLVRRCRYRDRAGVEREMLTTTRFHPAPRRLEQYWTVMCDDHVAAARMHSHFWPVDRIVGALTTAGFRIVKRIDTPIGDGAGRGAGVIFLRAARNR